MLSKHVLTENGQVLLIENVSPADTERVAREFYEGVGGADFFYRLATAFHQLVADDPLLSPLFPGSVERQANRLARHYIRMYGT
ncbi:hypothetical protein AB0J64_44380, partial [Nonomuraea sp. NPDC049695]